MTYQDFWDGHGVVCVHAQLGGAQRNRFPEFGGQEHADGSQQLQMAFVHGILGHVPVQVVNGQRKHLLLALLILTHLLKNNPRDES